MKKRYFNVLLTTAGDNKDESNDLLASIDVSEGDVVKGLVDFYLNMRGVEGSKFVDSIGTIILERTFLGKCGVCYSTNIDRKLLGRNSFYYSDSCKDDVRPSYGMDLEISLDCVVAIMSFSTYAEGKRYIGCVTYLIETKFEDDGVHVRLLSRDHRSEIRYEIFRGNLLYLISSLWIYKLTRYVRTSELEKDLRGINVSELTGYRSPTVILSKGFFECILSWGMGAFNPLTPPNPSTGNRLIDLFDLFKGYIV